MQQEDNAASSSQQAASTWNKAGTFEERDVTEWATQRLQDMVVGTSSGAAVVTKCRTITGHANIWCVHMSLVAHEPRQHGHTAILFLLLQSTRLLSHSKSHGLVTCSLQFCAFHGTCSGHACLASSRTARIGSSNHSTPCACTHVGPAAVHQQAGLRRFL